MRGALGGTGLPSDVPWKGQRIGGGAGEGRCLRGPEGGVEPQGEIGGMGLRYRGDAQGAGGRGVAGGSGGGRRGGA